jgi:aminocarboxymuconate-semialdehyde decarboxylase
MCLSNGLKKGPFVALGFSNSRRKGYAVKSPAGALHTGAVGYRLSLGREVKTEIPAQMRWNEKQIAEEGETMPNRRDFLKTVAGATAGMFVAGRRLAGAGLQAPQATPVKRREVFVGGRRVKVVDVHAHCVIPEVRDLVKDTKLASRVSNLVRGSNVMGPERLRTLDEKGIDVQVLSINGFWFYAAERDLAGQIVKLHNEKLAEWCAAHPDRYVALTSVALQYPDLAAEQLEHAVKQLGMRGAAIGCHVGGEDLSSPKFDLFWAKAEQLGVLVFMHPQSAENIVQKDAWKGRGDLGNIIGNPLETTVALSRLIFDGTLDRFPGLKICGAHAGGYLPSYLGRTEVACQVRANADCANKKLPSEYFKKEIMVDSIILSEEGLRHLVAVVGAGQVVYGTDDPFNWPVSVDMILNASFLSDAEKQAILGGNLVKLLRL